jgi:class III poly(R)-hydroxyalkanoic acid synthase PhaE subunit
MQQPEATEALFKGVGAIPEIMTKLLTPALEAFFHLQREWIERTARIGESTSAYKFENLDQEAFRAWLDIYEKEFRQFLHVPQLGLIRFYQERANEALDRFNILQATMAEFISVLYLPFERSAKVMQENLGEMAASGKLPEKTKDYYRVWVKILEGLYLNLFKSPEYTDLMARTLNAMENYMVARRRVMEDALQSLPLPTLKDVDECYKEIYSLKKRVKELEKHNKEVERG